MARRNKRKQAVIQVPLITAPRSNGAGQGVIRGKRPKRTQRRRRGNRSGNPAMFAATGVDQPVMAPRAMGMQITGQQFGRSVACPSIGNTPGQAYAAKGVSGTFGPTLESGVQGADAFMYCRVNPQGAFTATTTNPLGSVPTSSYLTGGVAQAMTVDYDSFWGLEIEARYVPTVGTGTPGEVAICFVPEISAVPDPTTITSLLDMPISAMGPVWAPLSVRFRPGNTPTRFSECKRMATGASTSTADTCHGVLVVGLSGVSNGLGSGTALPVGRIEVRAHWCLWTPSVPGLQ